MRDVLGYRARLGVVVPSTNTIMEPELAALAPPGVTVHGARMRVARPALGTEAEARAFIAGVRAALAGAVADVATAEPDRVLVGISALSFMGGVAGHRELKDALGATTATGVTTAAGRPRPRCRPWVFDGSASSRRTRRCSTRTTRGSSPSRATRS